MPRPRTDKVVLQVRLRPADVQAIEEQRRRTGARTLSEGLETALIEVLDEIEQDSAAPAIALAAGPLRRRAYKIAPDTRQRLIDVAAATGIDPQQIVRAAASRLPRS